MSVATWHSFLSGLYFGTGFRPARGVIYAFAEEANRLGLTVEEHSYDFLAWVATHSSSLLFRLFGAFPTTSTLDAFTGANENPIATNWSGPILNGGGQMQRISNQAAAAAATGALHASWYDISTFGPDSEAFIDIATLPDDFGETHLWLRLASPGVASSTDGYKIRILHRTGAPASNLRFDRYDNSVPTQLGVNQTPGEWASGDALGFEMIGSTLQAYRKPSGGAWGTYGTSESDGTYTAAGSIGMGASDDTGPTGRYDNFGGGTVVGAADTPYRPVQTGFVPRALRTMVAN